MSTRNANDPVEWQQPQGNWDDPGYYTDETAPVAASRRGPMQRIWAGRPMIYILAAGLIAVTALVLLTRPDAPPVASPAAATTSATRAPITYDAGPVIENELNKP